MQPMAIGCPTDEVRQLLLEASGLKLKDSYNSSKIDVHCLLFTDFLLICKQLSKRTSDRLKIIRQPFLVNRLRTHELKDQSGLVMIYLNELNVASTFFTLYTTDTRIWIQKLKEAKKSFKNLQQISKEKERLEQLLKNKPSLQIMKSTEDEYYEDYYDLSNNAIQSASSLQQHPYYPYYLQQQQQLILSSQFSSSRSSLIKSQSNSIDQSEASAYGSNLILAAPASTPNPLFNTQIACCSSCGQQINLSQQHTKQQATANQAQQKQMQKHDQQSSFTSTTLGSISTLESCSICNLPNVFVNNNSTNTTTTNSNVLMTTGYSSNPTTQIKMQTNLHQQQQSSGNAISNTIRNQTQMLNPNQIHSKYLLNANMSLAPDSNQQRAISFELGELRNPSITVDDLDCLGRSQSMERPTHSPTFLRPERRAFLIKGRPTTNTQLTASNTHNTNPHLIAAFPSNSASNDSTTCSLQHYCSQCNNRISLSSSENNYNIVIAAGGLIDQNSLFNKSTNTTATTTTTTTTNSSSSLQPTHSQTTSHLRQAKSLEKEYNPSICGEEQFILPVPNINKIYRRSLDEILDKTKQNSSNENEANNKKLISKMNTTATSKITSTNLPIVTTSILATTTSTSSSSGGSKPPLIKMKNVILNSTNVLPSINQVKSAPSSGNSSPKNLSFDSDIGDLAISDPGDYTTSTTATNTYQQQKSILDNSRSMKEEITRHYLTKNNNSSIKSSISLDDGTDLNEQARSEFKVLSNNIPSFLIEEEISKSTEDETDKQSIDLIDKNDLNNNLI